MATAFRRKGSRVVGSLAPQEREVVTGLLGQVRELLGGDDVAPTGDPIADLIGGLDEAPPDTTERDPALARLLPDGHEDSEEATEFRALTERSLRAHKVARLDTAIAVLTDARSDRLELDFGQAQELMIALTDARLVLADRIGLHTEEDAERLHERIQQLIEDDTDTGVDETMALFYDFLTWLQESLAGALLSSGRRGPAH